MKTHLDRELGNLKGELLKICEKVEQSVQMATDAYQNKDREMCKKVMNMDEEIDHLEVKLEEDCLKVLALHQPMAKDLRLVVTTLKINSDLERIADLAVNFAARSRKILKKSEFTDHFDYSQMASAVREMLRGSIDSLVLSDLSLAKKVWNQDEIVDKMHKKRYKDVYKKIAERPEFTEMYVNQLSLSRYLERIADFATNIAEDVIYLVSGEIVRHNIEELVLDEE